MHKRILAVGAHPDDIELGCAGFIQTALAREIVILSAGEKGATEDRRLEAMKSAKTLKAYLFLHDLPDTKIDVCDAIEVLEERIREFQPDTILTMSEVDTHQDHQVVSRATKVAARDTLCTILSYISPSSAQYFHPTWFVPVSEEQMKVKLAALACHYSQRHRQYFQEEYVIGTAHYWAMITRSQSEYIEPYQLVRHWEI